MVVASPDWMHLTLTYNKLRTDLSYEVEWSPDGKTWSTIGVDQGGPGPLVTASVPINGGAKMLRLHVTQL